MKNHFLLPLSLLILFSCSKKPAYSDTTTEQSERSIEMVDSSFVNAATPKDKKAKFTQDVNINMQVKDVYNSTLAIEKNVISFGGYISKSDLNTNTVSNKTIAISKDSARETKVYSVSNFMIIKIPTPLLNNFLLSLNDQIDFLNFRKINTSDISSNLEALKLDNARLNNDKSNLDLVLSQNGKTLHKNDVVNSISNTQYLKNENIIQNKELSNKMAMATVTLFIEQNNKIRSSIIPNTDDISDNSDFIYKCKKGLANGVSIISFIFIIIINLWPFIIIGLIVLFLRKWILKKYKKRN